MHLSQHDAVLHGRVHALPHVGRARMGRIADEHSAILDDVAGPHRRGSSGCLCFLHKHGEAVTQAPAAVAQRTVSNTDQGTEMETAGASGLSSSVAPMCPSAAD